MNRYSKIKYVKKMFQMYSYFPLQKSKIKSIKVPFLKTLDIDIFLTSIFLDIDIFLCSIFYFDIFYISICLSNISTSKQ